MTDRAIKAVHPAAVVTKEAKRYIWPTFALLHLFAPWIWGSVILYFSMLCRWVPAEDQLAPSFIDTAQHDPLLISSRPECYLFFCGWVEVFTESDVTPYQVQVSTRSPHTQFIYHRERDMTGLELQSEHFHVTINGTTSKAKKFWIGLTSQQDTSESLGQRCGGGTPKPGHTVVHEDARSIHWKSDVHWKHTFASGVRAVAHSWRVSM